MKYILLAVALIVCFVGDMSWRFSQVCLGALEAIVSELKEIRELEMAEARMAAKHE